MCDNITDRIGPQIKIANTLIEKELNNRIAQQINDYNLTGPQITLLVYLYHHSNKTVTQKQIADMFFLSHPTIRSIVKRLEKQELIIVGNLLSDRRQVTLKLSDTGAALIAKEIAGIELVMDEVNHKIVGQLDVKQQSELSAILGQIIRNF